MSATGIVSIMNENPALQLVIDETSVQPLSNDDFDPKKHIDFVPPTKVHNMSDLKLPEGTGVSAFAVSEPFQLFTEEAVARMRAEIFSKAVLENCRYSSNLAQCQLRGFAAKYAPFVYDVWKNPETLAIISKIAGVELVTEMDFEIAHINISVKSEKQKAEELEASVDKKMTEDDEGIAGCPWEDDKPIVDWHTDSYPFVCVTMLSDCRGMIGGETALRTGDGGIVKVRGPERGHAVVLQGRYIEHQALRALGTTERITMVTSFRPKSHTVKDDTVLTTVRPISNLSELYYQFSEYRLEILEERIREKLKALRETERSGRKMNTKDLKAFLHEQEMFLAHMNKEMVDDALVTKGSIDDSHLFSGFAKRSKRKRIE
ncbi:hypothetical protein N7G274_006967 [Stereocaulon virgatum]|uniref:Fe2OG dioxygenase domain-containing protein n=1 Tax=Stereocaulon virgatum TaxID=373712 RepID=A0ABR4A296_9LECA